MTTVNHPCRKQTSGPFEWCMHEACRPEGRISEELKRMDQAPAYKTLGDAQDALIKALEIVRTIELDITSYREAIADKEERIRGREEEMRRWGDEAKKALAVVAMGFHMTVKEDNG